MEQIRLSYTEAIMYLALFGVVLGILLGLIPLILGIRKKKRQYGIFGFVASIICGAIMPLLSIIVVAIFTWLILRKPDAENDSPEISSDSEIS